jgi:diguanylate cyclase (GGDEF)-like protein
MFKKIVALLCLLIFSHFLQAADKVVLQLKWEHQFQFAGYYAADWQGFYREEGLEVEIRPAVGPDKQFITPYHELVSGRAQFAIGALDILTGRTDGTSPVVLAPIFQKSPMALFSLASTNIDNVEKLTSLRIGVATSEPARAEIEALLLSHGLTPDKLNFVNRPLTVDTLLKGEADVIATYRISANYEAKEKGIQLNELSPTEYGLAFYGDTLYSTREFVDNNRDLTRRFIKASLRGWEYALANKQSIAKRITDELPRYVIKFNDTYQFNLSFAEDIEQYLKYPEFPLGHINKAIWFNMNERMRSIGLVSTQLDLNTFYFDSDEPSGALSNSFAILTLLFLIPLIFFFWFKKHRSSTLVAIILTAFILEYQIEKSFTKNLLEKEKASVTQQLNSITAQLQGNLQNNLSMLTGFAAYISAEPDLSIEDFNRYAQQLFKKNPVLINFAAAKDLKVNYVYPLKGNEKVIGLDYRKNPAQVEKVMQVVNTGQMLVIGPVNLVQGGTAFIGRAPISTSDGKLWGIISAPIDSERLFQYAEIEKLSRDVDISIRSFDALGNASEVFYGDPEVINAPNRSSTLISVGGGSWQIDAISKKDMSELSDDVLALRGYFIFATLLLTIFVIFRFRQQEERLLLQQKIKDDKVLLESVGNVAKIGGWKLDFELQFTKWSSSCSNLMGQDKSFQPQRLSDLNHFFTEDDYALISSKIKQALNRSLAFDIEVRIAIKDQAPVWLRIMSDGVNQKDEQAIVGTLQDVTNKVISAKLIEHQATFDSLTGLPNRVLYNDRLEKSIDMAKRKQQIVAVMFVDLDRFKPINDNHGHQAGDRVLIETAHRIKQAIRQSDTVSRLSGDEFAIILNDVKGYQDIRLIADNITEKIQAPYILGDVSVHSSASIGIALFPNDADNADLLLRKADQAMYEVKGSGRNGCQFYTKEMQRRSEHRHALLNDLIVAVNNEQLQAYVQPIFDLKNNQMVRCESLARWIKPTGEFIAPDEFIALAEESGLINKIDLFMLKNSGRFLEQLDQDIGLSINISPRLFHTKDKALENWLSTIKEIKKNIQITVEITERLLTDDSESALVVLRDLRAHGIKIAIDDFGTGYSSLSYLIKYPVDIIKIDKSFVQDIGESSSAETLIESILAMASQLDIAVVAEGIETKAQLNYLKLNGCDFGQGYYLGRPVEQKVFVESINSKGT